MTILITGANGTISSALLAMLASTSDAKPRADDHTRRGRR